MSSTSTTTVVALRAAEMMVGNATPGKTMKATRGRENDEGDANDDGDSEENDDGGDDRGESNSGGERNDCLRYLSLR